jgi:glycerol-3-phosphate acyltransferase PlsY
VSLLPEIQRKAIHLTFILVPLAYHFDLLSRRLIVRGLLVATLVSIVIELARLHDARARAYFRMFFGNLIRTHEHRQLLGSTYLLIASVITIELFSEPYAVAALGALILGDTAAALVGRTLGRVKLFGKSLEGSLACFIVSFLFAWGVVGLSAETAALGMLAATLFEFLPIPLDDNFRIPLSAGYVMKFFHG